MACILALCLNPSVGLCQPQDDEPDINDPLIDVACTAEPSGVGARAYPFSVSAIDRNLKIGGLDAEQVNVLVIDNSFYGYKPNSSGQNPPRLSSRNYHRGFFLNDPDIQNDFAPWVQPEDSSAVSPPQDLEKRHGTLIAGIILGGMYEGDTGPEESDVHKPSARKLLLFNAADKPWLRISFLNVEYGSDEEINDPVLRLKTLDDSTLAAFKIVNMSLAKELSGSEPIKQLPERNALPALVVTAAGNGDGGQEEIARDGSGVKAVPAILGDDRMLVVASHDADGRLSKFSNYGRPVNIAAPGCKIRSWTDGEEPARSLSGTSMATAVVSFGAALVASRWQPRQGGTAIRNRILASARYNKDLEICSSIAPPAAAQPTSSSPPYCVKDGAMLDIETAVLVSRDYIEYDDCGPNGDQPCVAKVALGELSEIPSFVVTRCMEPIENRLRHGGLTLNGSIKRTDRRDNLLVAYEPGLEIGIRPLSTKRCEVDDDALAQEIAFEISDEQLDGSKVTPPAPLRVQLGNLTRLVTRSIK